MIKMILIVATLDTRADEVSYLKALIEDRGHKVLVIDAGVMGKPSMRADFTRAAVARSGGKVLAELLEAAKKGADRFEATRVMIKGVEKITRDLYAKGKLNGVLALGGSTGTALGEQQP